jgi:hypothetical protein
LYIVKIGSTQSRSPKQLYVIECSNGKYYVGQCATERVEARLMEHMNGEGSSWTRLHKPIRHLLIEDLNDPLDEDNMVLKQMRKHGIDNVRGGSYSQITLSDDQVQSLRRQLDHATDRCIRCGRDSHWANNCYAKTHIDGSLLQPHVRTSRDNESQGYYRRHQTLEQDDRPRAKARSVDRNEMAGNVCYRCGRDSHWANNCYAKTHIDGYPLN